MNCRDLLDSDSTFRAFLHHWETDRRCPLPLVDYLLELGLEGQAEGARWASEYPDRREFCGADFTGPFPRCPAEHHWYWFSTLSEDFMEFSDCLPSKPGFYVNRLKDFSPNHFRTLEKALCSLLDGFADYLTENPNALQSLRCSVQSGSDR